MFLTKENELKPKRSRKPKMFWKCMVVESKKKRARKGGAES